jgi:large subunit ribosomal protein L22
MKGVEKFAIAKISAIKGSVQKLKLVSDLVKGMKVSDALLQLHFCNRKLARDVKFVLNSAISNAENNFGMDIDKLYVSKIDLGKSFYLKRFHPRGRGRSASVRKPFSKMTVYVSERG